MTGWEVSTAQMIPYPLRESTVAYLPSLDYLAVFIIRGLAVLILHWVHESAVVGGDTLEVIARVSTFEDDVGVGNPECKEDLKVGTLGDLSKHLDALFKCHEEMYNLNLSSCQAYSMWYTYGLWSMCGNYFKSKEIK